MAGETDTAVVMAESADPLIIAAQAELATTANALFGLTVTPESASKLALAGFDVTYAVQVTNTGNTTDTFTLAISSTWDTEVPTSTQPLAAGESAMVTVVVHVAVGATAGEADTASLTVASVGDPAQTALVALTTQVGYGQYLPVTLKQ